MKCSMSALHVPSQETITYGPWESSEDPNVAIWQAGYAAGFLSGLAAGNGASPGDMTDFQVIDAPEETNTEILGVIKTHAEASVTHPDGTVD